MSIGSALVDESGHEHSIQEVHYVSRQKVLCERSLVARPPWRSIVGVEMQSFMHRAGMMLCCAYMCASNRSDSQ